jgi:hypothetical protein
LVEIREDLPEGQDPSPSVAAFNKSFGTSHRGELLSVGCEVASNKDGASRILTLWKSPALINETEEGASEQMLHSFGEAARDSGKRHCTPSKKTSVSLDKPSASSGKKVAAKDLNKKRLITLYSFLCFKFLNFPLMALFCDFSEFEDLLRSYPASKFAEYRRDYATKASISGRIACECLIEQEKINKKLLEDSQKLSRDFKLSRAANSDLEKKVAELVVALKKCQDEKKVVEVAAENSRKDLEKLQKTHDEDLKLIENLRKDYDKSSKVAEDLRVNNADLSN